MNSLCEKVKLQKGQFKSLKQIFCKFKGQFDLEWSRSRSQIFRIVQDLKMINTQLKFEGEIPTVQKLLHSQFDLKGQGHQFSNTSEIFRFLIKSSS